MPEFDARIPAVANGLAASRYMVLGAITAVLAATGMAVLLVALGLISPWLLPGVAAWALVVLAGFGDSLHRLARGQEPRLGAAR